MIAKRIVLLRDVVLSSSPPSRNYTNNDVHTQIDLRMIHCLEFHNQQTTDVANSHCGRRRCAVLVADNQSFVTLQIEKCGHFGWWDLSLSLSISLSLQHRLRTWNKKRKRIGLLYILRHNLILSSIPSRNYTNNNVHTQIDFHMIHCLDFHNQQTTDVANSHCRRWKEMVSFGCWQSVVRSATVRKISLQVVRPFVDVF